MGGREVSRPYRVWFFAEGERFLCFLFQPPVFIHWTIFLGKDREDYIYITNVVHLCFFRKCTTLERGIIIGYQSFVADAKYRVPTMQNRLGDLICPPSKKSFYYQGFFAVKWRAVFILGAKWKALVRGWRSDCVVGGMETRFQWRKAHSPSAKCEAFQVAPRLFFMFLFQSPLYLSTEPKSWHI